MLQVPPPVRLLVRVLPRVPLGLRLLHSRRPPVLLPGLPVLHLPRLLGQHTHALE